MRTVCVRAGGCECTSNQANRVGNMRSGISPAPRVSDTASGKYPSHLNKQERPALKQCPFCGANFAPTQNQKYCGADCMKRAYYVRTGVHTKEYSLQLKKTSVAGSKGTCKWCGKLFRITLGFRRGGFCSNRHANSARDLKYKYGITIDDYNDMLAAQSSACDMCGKPHTIERRLVVDHNHTTRRVRGLLCDGCNIAVGFYETKKEITKRYLAKHGEPT